MFDSRTECIKMSEYFNNECFRYITSNDVNKYLDQFEFTKGEQSKIKANMRNLIRSGVISLDYRVQKNRFQQNPVYVYQVNLFDKSAPEKNNNYWFRRFAIWFTENYPYKKTIDDSDLKRANQILKTGKTDKDFIVTINRQLARHDMSRVNFYFSKLDPVNEQGKYNLTLKNIQESKNYAVREDSKGFCIVEINPKDMSILRTIKTGLPTEAVASKQIRKMLNQISIYKPDESFIELTTTFREGA